jgi:hypothetical protein
MNLHQLVSIVFVVGLALLPSVIAAWINGSGKSEPEQEFDYR